MPRYFKVPEDRKDEPGVFIGGAWIGFKNGIAETPDGGDYTWALKGFVEVQGPQIPGADAPQPLDQPDDTNGIAAAPKPAKGGKG